MHIKKAMTMSEVLVCLAIIGVLAMILVPVISHTTANKERFLYKKSLNTMQNAISSVMAEQGVVNSANFWPDLSDNGMGFREAITKKLIVIGDGSKLRPEYKDSLGNYDNDEILITNDGVVYYGIPEYWPTTADGQAAKAIVIRADVNGERGANAKAEDMGPLPDNPKLMAHPDKLKILIKKDGRVMIPAFDDEGKAILTEGGSTSEMELSGYNSDDWSYETEYMTSSKGDH